MKSGLKYLALFFFFISLQGFSQSDTIRKEKKLNKKLVYREARKAAVMSAVIPGLGQLYNRKWWKFPVIYAGLGGFGYLFYVNEQRFEYYGSNLRAEYDGDANTINSSGYSGDQLIELKKDARKNRDLGVIGFTVFYALNIIDANVDAHLKTFDVSDDLSLKLSPHNSISMMPGNTLCFQTGLTIKFNYKKK